MTTTIETQHIGFYRSAMCGGMLLRKRNKTVDPVLAVTKERTPAEHRAEIAAWGADAPKHDHQIFDRKIETKKARHKNLAALGALISFRNRPDGVAEGVPADGMTVLRSNWNLVPANDNTAPQEDGVFDAERAVEYEPSIDFIESEIEKLPMEYRAEPSMLSTVSSADRLARREVQGVPSGDKVGYGWHVDDNGKRHKVVVRIGRLRFSDGTQTERGPKKVMDAVVEADIRMTVGAMLSTREKSSRDKGGDVDPSNSNSHYRWLVRAKIAEPPKLHRKQADRNDIGKAEARKVLAKAYAQTGVPDVTYCPDGWPYGPSNLRQLFIGGRKGKTGESGSETWQDVYIEHENRIAFNKALDAMQDEHVRVLTEAVTARSLGQLGEVRGYKGRHAIAAGRRLLVAANNNFEEAMMMAEYAKKA